MQANRASTEWGRHCYKQRPSGESQRVTDAELCATNDELGDVMLGVADGSVDKEALTEFFRKHVEV
jgi:hypothetical protein